MRSRLHILQSKKVDLLVASSSQKHILPQAEYYLRDAVFRIKLGIQKVDQFVWHVKFGDNFANFKIVEHYGTPLETKENLMFPLG